jgi:hypothetical protein
MFSELCQVALEGLRRLVQRWAVVALQLALQGDGSEQFLVGGILLQELEK